MENTTEFYGQKIAVSTLGKDTAVAYTFKNTVDNNETNVSTVKVDVKDKQGTVIAWGKKNDWPQQVLAAVKLNGSAGSGLRFLRKAHYGNGLVLTRDEVVDGKRKSSVVPLADVPEIQEFFKKSQMNRFWKETIADLEYFSIAFPEYILSENYQQINRVKRQKAAWCRYEEMNKENGLVENVYISQKFGRESVNSDSEYVEVVPVIDSYWTPDQVKEYCKTNEIKKFIRPIFYPMLDEAYYPESEWHSVVRSGWLDVANSVPELKKSIFQNQMTIKYLVEIDERYFENLYRDNWHSIKPEERIKIRQDVVDLINNSLSGNENAGKTIQGMKIVGSDGKPYSAVTITPIDDKLKDGSYLPEAEAANSEVLFALGVDPALIGAGIPGGKLGAGSGSDKREALTILMSLFKTNRETTLEPFEFISEYNGWDSSIKAQFENTILTTLDANPTGVQNAVV